MAGLTFLPVPKSLEKALTRGAGQPGPNEPNFMKHRAPKPKGQRVWLRVMSP